MLVLVVILSHSVPVDQRWCVPESACPFVATPSKKTFGPRLGLLLMNSCLPWSDDMLFIRTNEPSMLNGYRRPPVMIEIGSMLVPPSNVMLRAFVPASIVA